MQHLHSEMVEGCYRCGIGEDEVSEPMNYMVKVKFTDEAELEIEGASSEAEAERWAIESYFENLAIYLTVECKDGDYSPFDDFVEVSAEEVEDES